MLKLKSIFHTLYFSYLIFSVLIFIFKNSLIQQIDPDILLRFVNFWVILGFVFFASIWIIQAIHIGFLRKDIMEQEAIITDLKSKLYNINRDTSQDLPDNPGSSVSQQTTD